MELWRYAMHYICLSSVISDKCAFNKRFHSFNQEFSIVSTLDSTAGKNTIRKIHHIGLQLCHGCPTSSQVVIPRPISAHSCA